MTEYDLIVVGAGPGGYHAAELASEQGMKVLLIEKGQIGGVCTNAGCIPTKSLLNAAKHYAHAQDSGKFGVHAEGVTFNLAEAMEWKNQTIETLRSGISFLLKKSKVEVLSAEAEVKENNIVLADGNEYKGTYLILATGSSPVIPPIPGADGENVVTSEELLEITEIPEELVIVGGGVIGIEFASLFSTLGTKVTVLEMADEILPVMDADIAKLMRRELKKVTIKTKCKVERIEKDKVLYTDAKGKQVEVPAGMVLMSVGRRPNTAGLDKIGLQLERSAVSVDEHMRTNLPNVYAVGDVNGKSLLAHSATRMAEVAVAHITGKEDRMRYHAVPWAVYTLPEAAACGLTEKEATDRGLNVKIASMQMRANGRFLAEHGKRASGLVKVIADADTGVILGVHMIGAASSEMIFGAATFIEAELRAEDVKQIIFPHPSVSEIIKDVCSQL